MHIQTVQWAVGLIVMAGIPLLIWLLGRLVTTWTKFTASINDVIASAGVLKYATDEMKMDIDDHENRLRVLEKSPAPQVIVQDGGVVHVEPNQVPKASTLQ